MAPRFDAKLNTSIIAVRRPLGEFNRESKGGILAGVPEQPQGRFTSLYLAQANLSLHCETVSLQCLGEGLAGVQEANGEDAPNVYTAGPAPEKLLRELQQQLKRLFAANPSQKMPIMMGTS